MTDYNDELILFTTLHWNEEDKEHIFQYAKATLVGPVQKVAGATCRRGPSRVSLPNLTALCHVGVLTKT